MGDVIARVVQRVPVLDGWFTFGDKNGSWRLIASRYELEDYRRRWKAE